METIRKISRAELMRFKIGLDGLPYRKLNNGDCAVAVMRRVGKADDCGARWFFPVTTGGSAKGRRKNGVGLFWHISLERSAAGDEICLCSRAPNRLASGRSHARGSETGHERAFDLHHGPPGACHGQHDDLGRAKQFEID